ncbi:NADH:flavin oxidoreductase/NADH oxidase [Microbacterium thalassium]|uniref:2,4-dienoyl-CoA reductase-like NADH-dependent reductase (Old Yellow Enzyme family) n=1 Tax=Microbacterium thalassium TaxID=362649 RepID=A0A7X0KUP3_9MICO|nr:NADH:flavin oxidoreductase/NADH oxidase [Microbacterium thalassium]MBB6391366.1 2,4-dienoyl-CoA reductase-like NADH-dependent reductase (Old Yellow Enzyme family) [Microbacterium thalassium]GLK23336.1 oxidoreductase [Microbacterium thalassium]
MPHLFDPLAVRGTTFRNRLWVAPMCQYSATDGMPGDWHLTHLAQFASGGAGLVIAEATAVVPAGRISPEDTGLWNDAQRDAWRPIAAAIRSRGARAGIQLAHAGRKASTYAPFADRRGTVPPSDGGWRTVAPSAIAFEGYDAPETLDAAGIDDIVAAFGAAARRAVDAGFDVVEIHAAHGYLIHEFLSPLSNRRDDEYGGTLEGRARLLLRVVETVRDAVGDAPVFVRFSATDWADGGLGADEVATVATWAGARGADFFDISSGGLVAHQRIPVGPGYQVHLAEHVREATGLPVSAVGMIDDAAHAERVVTGGAADAVMAAREWLRDPHYALRASTELAADIDYWPPQYLRARPRRAG